jgi:protein O-GlcNAc transferase
VLAPQTASDSIAEAEVLLARGQWAAAETILEAAAVGADADAALWFTLGKVRYQLGRPTAMTAFERAHALQPNTPATLFMVGTCLLREGRPADAIASLQTADVLDPTLSKCALHLGVALAQTRQWAAAAQAMQRALQAEPGERQAQQVLAIAEQQLPRDAAKLAALGRAAQEAGQPLEAEALYRRALAANPVQMDAAWEIGLLFLKKADWLGVINLFEPLLADKRALPGMYMNVIAAHINLANYEAACRITRAHLDHQCSPEQLGEGLGFYVYLGAFDTGISRLAQRAYADQWSDWLSRDIAEPLRPTPKPRQGRKLRIGYLWSMFGYPIEFPFIACHDRSRYALYAYAYGREDDRTPANIGRFDAYRWIGSMGDAEAARMIAADEIDILVDLGGQGWQQRSKIAEYRAAPVQIGYSNKLFTTGSARVDWLIGNPGTFLPEDAAYYRERLYTLPRMFVQCAWQRDPPSPVEPRTCGERIVIGTPAALYKVNRGALDFWCEILRRLPEADLRLDFGPYPPGALKRIRDHFSAAGFGPERCELVEQRAGSFFSYVDSLDLAVDAFPFTANFTAFQAIARGVPLVTVRTDCYVGRLAPGLLDAIGRGEWVARDSAHAVEIAVELARDRERRAVERNLLPELLESAGVLDADAYARAMEEAYETIFADRERTVSD